MEKHHHPHATRHIFIVALLLNGLFIIIEVVFGILADSLALIADAGHNFSDVLGLLLAWGGSYLSTRRPTERRTYGLRRTSILAALLNASLLLVAVGIIAKEAIDRLMHPAAIAGGIVIPVAAAGILINGITAWLFHRSGQRDLNMRGAFLHMAADAGVSLGVVFAALLIMLTGWFWLDPAVSLIIALVIAIGAWRLLLESLNLTLDAVPAEIDPVEVRAYLASQSNVIEVHDLHIWAMSTTETALTAHVVMSTAPHNDDWLRLLHAELNNRFHIGHATIQIEMGNGSQRCPLAPEHVV